MILTDREIKIAIARGIIRIAPTPDEVRAFSSTAVDLTLDTPIRTFNPVPTAMDSVIDPGAEGFNSDEMIGHITQAGQIPASGYTLKPNNLLLAWTKEYVELSEEARLAARVEGKSSLARLGLAVHVTAPTIHAGFKGQIQLEMINHGIVPIRLRKGMRICQLIFEITLGTPEKGYQGQFAGQTSKAPIKKSAAKKRAA